jgi:hypothetical protein
MSLIFVGKMNVPTYTCLDADIIANAVAGASIVGGTIFVTDTTVWKIIKSDLTLADYVLPVEVTVTSDIDIGAIHIDQQISESVELGFFHDAKSVAVPGTSESLTSTDVYVVSVAVYPKTASVNVGNIYFGNSAVDRSTSKQFIITSANSGIAIDVGVGNKLNLKSLFIDADNAGDGVEFNYLK